MKAIYPHLWFDNSAVQAAELYTSLFPESDIISKSILRDTPSGDCDMVSFRLWGQRFDAISGGPGFSFNPSLSFMVNYDPLFFKDFDDPESEARKSLRAAWERLSEGGKTLMDLGSYDFSPLYGWTQDRFGLSWQLIYTDPGGDPRPPIMPALLNTGRNFGRTEEAGEFYRSVFPGSQAGMLVPYPTDMGWNKKDTIMFSDYRLGDLWIVAMDSGQDEEFPFNESVSLVVPCETQKEIDYYWEKLSAVPEAEQCGWLKDRYGLSWQIIPAELETLMERGSEGQRKALTEAFLQMKKFDIAQLHLACQ